MKSTFPAATPDHTVEEAARDVGATVECLWEMPGPSDIGGWLACLFINGSICLVQTFSDGGWEAYTPCNSRRIDDTLEDVLSRCGVISTELETE